MARETYDSNGQVIATEDTPEPEVSLRAADFLARFTNTEQAAIWRDSTLAPIVSRLFTADVVVLSSPELVTAVQQIQATGILSEQRVAEILTP